MAIRVSEPQRRAGLVAYNFFEDLEQRVRPGLNLLEIEAFARQTIEQNGCQSAFQGYKGYPAVTCLSVNSAIVHGLPVDYELQDGDVISVDIGVAKDGKLVDTARTFAVGQISPINKNLLEVTNKALLQAVKVCRVGNTVGDIGSTVQQQVEAAGFSIIRELTGHGVGPTLQEPPSVPNYGKPGQGPRLTAGMVLAIEPITATKPTKVAVLADGWTITAQEETVCAHFEHTVLITENEPVVLTGK